MSKVAENAYPVTPLKELGEIRAGYPFRGAIANLPKGDVRVISLKDTVIGQSLNWESLTRTTLKGKKQTDWLIEGDILFQARGNNNHAHCLVGLPKQVVCAPHFFQIRLPAKSTILPEFLAWQINQRPAQLYFNATKEASSIVANVRRQVLEELSIRIPPIAKQQQVLQLVNAIYKEKRLLQGLVENGQRIMSAVAEDVLTEKIKSTNQVNR